MCLNRIRLSMIICIHLKNQNNWVFAHLERKFLVNVQNVTNPWMLQNERPPLAASCQPAIAHLIKRCWAVNPSKRPDFSEIVCALEKYDECVKEGLPLTLHSGLVSKNAIIERLKGCVSMNSSSVPVHAWAWLLMLLNCLYSKLVLWS